MTPNDFGKKILVDRCQKISFSDFLKEANKQLKKSTLQLLIEADGFEISIKESKTGSGGVRYWFDCPLCHKRTSVIYRHPVSQILGCRRCLKLDYRKHRYKGMIEGNTS